MDKHIGICFCRLVIVNFFAISNLFSKLVIYERSNRLKPLLHFAFIKILCKL